MGTTSRDTSEPGSWLRETSARATRREEGITMLLAAWTVVGIFIDAFYHSTDPTLETFWSPWHAIFYSGFAATTAWLTIVALRHRAPGAPALAQVPLGFRAAFAGVALFAAGGGGDAIWHTAFGVEESLDALLSPTHLMLWLGALAIVTTPLRAAWRDPDDTDASRLVTFALAIASLTLTTALVAFFLEYGWVPATDLPYAPFDPSTDAGQFAAAFGVLGVIVTTMVLMAPTLLTAARWRMPPGSFTILFTTVAVLIAFGFDNDRIGILPQVVAGAVADVASRRGLDRRVLGAGVPAVLWGLYFLAVGRRAPIAWPPEIWGGQIFFGALTGLALAVGIDVVRGLGARSSARTVPTTHR